MNNFYLFYLDGDDLFLAPENLHACSSTLSSPNGMYFVGRRYKLLKDIARSQKFYGDNHHFNTGHTGYALLK